MNLYDLAIAKKLAGGGGGGEGGLTPTVEKTYNVSTTSTTAIDIDTIRIPLEDTIGKWMLTIIEDTNGQRTDYFYAWTNTRFNGAGNGGSYFKGGTATGFSSSSNAQYGVYAVITATTTDRVIDIKAKYETSRTGTIDGTFKVRVFVF